MPVEPIILTHTVVLKGRLHQRHEEYNASAVMNPGYLCKMIGTVGLNGAGEIEPHPTSGGGWPLYFAKEEGLIGEDINFAYAVGDLVGVHIPERGDQINAKVASSATAILLGDPITSNGDGTVRKASGSDVIFAFAQMPLPSTSGEQFLIIEIV
jgi:hypothetical protein